MIQKIHLQNRLVQVHGTEEHLLGPHQIKVVLALLPGLKSGILSVKTLGQTGLVFAYLADQKIDDLVQGHHFIDGGALTAEEHPVILHRDLHCDLIPYNGKGQGRFRIGGKKFIQAGQLFLYQLPFFVRKIHFFGNVGCFH